MTFRSVYDGTEDRFTPESVAAIQAKLGSDIAMCLDVCAPAGGSRDELAEAVRLTTLWAARQRTAPRAEGQLLFGIAQGATDPELRRRSIEEIVDLDFDGHALGGLSVGEERDPMFETVADAAPLLPAEKPRYFMGIGDPEGILEVIERGVDMFDCVLPTRMGRTGTAITSTGRLNLKNARFARDQAPARRLLRLPGVLQVHARVHQAPGQSARAARAPSADTAQPPVPARPHRRSTYCDRERQAGNIQGRSARAHDPGSRVIPLIFFGAMIVLFWVLIVMPQRRRRQVQQQLLSSLEPGDEVMTIGGLFGTVREVGRQPRRARDRSGHAGPPGEERRHGALRAERWNLRKTPETPLP